MATKKNRIGAAVLAAAIGTALGGATPAPIWSSPAEAKDYYTRKRVNGRWITGRFPKRVPSNQAALPAATPSVASPAAAPPTLAGTPREPAEQPAQASPDEQARLLPLRQALEQRARSMASGGQAPGSGVRSVTYDFDKGVRIVTHTDGSVTEHPLERLPTGQIPPRP